MFQSLPFRKRTEKPVQVTIHVCLSKLDKTTYILIMIILRLFFNTLKLLSNDADDAGDDALYITSEIRDCLDLLGTSMALKMCLSETCSDRVHFQMEIRKISRRRLRKT